jgi:hypothetical protein
MRRSLSGGRRAQVARAFQKEEGSAFQRFLLHVPS